MKKSRILLGLSLVGLLTGCGAPQQGESNNNNQQQVVNGKDGVGIKSITLTGSEGNVDIYTITYTDGTTSIFKVTNGKDGAQGIQGEPGKDGVTPTIEIGDNGNWIINGEDSGINASGSKGDKGDKGDTGEQGPKGDKGDKGDTGDQGPKGDKGDKGDTGDQGPQGEKGETGETGEQGPQGDKGETGNGIERIELTDSNGNIDTYTIYFTDGRTTTFTITNGTDGSQGTSGENGKSAFEIFKEYYPEYKGSEEDWINDVIKGEFNKVKISFDANGGTLKEESIIEIKKGNAVGNILPTPEKDGKEFLGWYTGWSANDVQVTVNTPINADLNLIAKWDTYNVDFLNFDGTIFESFVVKHGEQTSEPLKEPTKPTDENHSYYFNHWDFDFSQKIYSDIQINPVWDEKEPVYTVKLGSYPQTVVSDETLKEELSNLPNGLSNGSILEYDGNKDGVNEKYLCKETTREAIAEDGTKIEVGLNYFKFEPIEWWILSWDSESYFVVSKLVLDAMHWNTTGYEIENPSTKEKEIVYNNYEKSDIRLWLNDEFYNFAFNEEEKNKILTTVVDNSANSTLNEVNEYACNNTEDKIYLLSMKELSSNPFNTDIRYYDENRLAKGTDYARTMNINGLISNDELYCEYWTRSPFPRYKDYIYYAHSSGSYSALSGRDCVYGVRPALHISLTKTSN